MASSLTATSDERHASPLRQALIIQFIAAGVMWLAFALSGRLESTPIWMIVAGQSVLAAMLSRVGGMAVWWLVLQFLLPWLMVSALTLNISPYWFLAGFLLLLASSRGALLDRVPLYLSNRKTCEALAALLPEKPCARFVDLGAGLGSVVDVLACERPDVMCHGVENSPLTWVLARLRLWRHHNAVIRYDSLWHENLSQYDMVYAFLSPAPMPALWRKVMNEMRPGSLFVSNSFVVPGVAPDQTIVLDDRRHTTLYLWRIPE